MRGYHIHALDGEIGHVEDFILEDPGWAVSYLVIDTRNAYEVGLGSFAGAIDPGTASAAEIVSGALQDAGRAELVGETTFGTGTVLNQFGLSDGSALLLATEEWLTPEGRLIWHHGIVPDVQVALPQGTAPLLPQAEAGMTEEQVRNSGDAQLLRALELLDQSADQQPAQSLISRARNRSLAVAQTRKGHYQGRSSTAWEILNPLTHIVSRQVTPAP